MWFAYIAFMGRLFIQKDVVLDSAEIEGVSPLKVHFLQTDNRLGRMMKGSCIAYPKHSMYRCIYIGVFLLVQAYSRSVLEKRHPPKEMFQLFAA